jgi:hypothetical protein
MDGSPHPPGDRTDAVHLSRLLRLGGERRGEKAEGEDQSNRSAHHWGA